MKKNNLKEWSKKEIEEINAQFLKACEEDDLPLVDFYLNNHSSILGHRQAFEMVITQDRLDVFKKLIEKENVSLSVGFVFLEACYENKIEFVKTIFSSKYKSDCQLAEGFYNACKTGALDIIQYLVPLKITYNSWAQKDKMKRGLFFAAERSQLNVVSYLLNAKNVPETMNLEDKNDALYSACYAGNLEVVKYLLTSAQLKEHAEVQSANNLALFKACAGKHLDIMQYLLESSELSTHAQLDNSILGSACDTGSLNIIKYLLETPIIKDNVDIYKGDIFERCCNKNYKDVIDYLVFDYKIENTVRIQLTMMHCHSIKDVFKKRELNENLIENLPIKETKKIKSKI